MHPPLVILAAGLGSRYGGLKQLEPVGPGGATIMDYTIYDAWRAGFSQVVFVIRPEMQSAFETSLGRRYAGRLPVAYAHQELTALPDGLSVPAGRTKPWGTGQAVLAAASLVNGPFAVANADDFYGPRSFSLLADFLHYQERGFARAAKIPDELRSGPIQNPKSKIQNASQANPALGSPPEPGLPTFALVTYALRATLPDHGPVARAVCQTTPDGWLSDIVEVTGIEKSGPTICVPDVYAPVVQRVQRRARRADSGMVSSGLNPKSKIQNPKWVAGKARAKPSLHGDEPVSMNLWAFTPAVFDLLRDEFRTFLQQHGQSPSAEFYLPAAIQAALHTGRARVKVLPAPDAWHGITHPQDKDRVATHIRALIEAGVYPEALWR